MAPRNLSKLCFSQELSRMPLRKQIIQNESDVPTETHHVSENTQEPEADGDADQKDEFSLSLLSPPSTRQKRRRERENKSKPKEMTEEEMMALAVCLSKQEASDTALRLQQEEQAVMKAIHQSMFDQTQPCPPSQSQSLLADSNTSIRSCSRRTVFYSNGKRVSAVSQGASEYVCTPERVSEDLPVTYDVKVLGVKESGGENNCRNKKRKRKEGSPLLDKHTSDSPCGSELPDSPQSSDSTQLDDCQLRKSPVFPSSACKAVVHIPPLSQDLLETCRMSGFVSFTQDSSTSPQKSLPLQAKSLTCPRSPSNLRTKKPKSPVFSETEQGDDKEMELSPEYLKSPVFGRNTQHQMSPCASKHLISVREQSHETSGVTFSSQESLTSTSRFVSCRPKSPVFPSSPGFPRNDLPPESPKFSETYRGPAETDNIMQRTCVVPSAAEIGSSNSDMTPVMENPPRSLRTHSNSQDVRLITVTKSPSPGAAQELKSDMTLVWSEEDEDVTPAGSASPVFPEERPVCRADVQVGSLDHVTPASSETRGLIKSSICQQQQQPISCQGSGSRPLVGRSTVHYYWGVPFCPRGLDPDTYTQVILAQMDVYDQSLRQAQRLLLRKAPWGDPILPQPEKPHSPASPAERPQDSPQHHAPRRLGLKLRHKRAAEDQDPPSEEEEEKNEEGGGEETQVDTDDCEFCPETQLSDDNDNTPELMMEADARVKPGSPDPPEVELILRDSSPAVVEPPEEEEEMEVDVGGKMEGSVTISSCDIGGSDMREELMEDDVDPHVEEISSKRLQMSTSPELELSADPQSSTNNVNCPICQGSFPVTEIELHAAYCEGEVAVIDERRSNSPPVSLKSRRKRPRRAEVPEAEETNSSSSSSSSRRNQEKCFICQKSVPLTHYSRHTELCMQRQPSRSDTRGNLLSALEQTETRGAEASRTSGPRLQLREVIDLRDDDDDDDGEESAMSAFTISNSPIRSFTPISEATDCLIDFGRQQRVKKPSHRRR